MMEEEMMRAFAYLLTEYQRQIDEERRQGRDPGWLTWAQEEVIEVVEQRLKLYIDYDPEIKQYSVRNG